MTPGIAAHLVGGELWASQEFGVKDGPTLAAVFKGAFNLVCHSCIHESNLARLTDSPTDG